VKFSHSSPSQTGLGTCFTKRGFFASVHHRESIPSRRAVAGTRRQAIRSKISGIKPNFTNVLRLDLGDAISETLCSSAMTRLPETQGAVTESTYG